MKRSDIVRLGKDAGFVWPPGTSSMVYTTVALRLYLARFAQLVAEHEREQIARLCETVADEDMYTGKQYAAQIRRRGEK